MFATNKSSKYDCVIVGGGLAGGMLLAALRSQQPDLNVLVIEKNKTLGGQHTWSFHETDLPRDMQVQAPWLMPLVSQKWDHHEVRFPAHERKINKAYYSIRAEDFHQKLMTAYPESILLETSVKSMTVSSVTLKSGEVIVAAQVIDARGWPKTSSTKAYGYQKFLGLDVELTEPHGLSGAILKDARIAQTDGYRFFYVLPWDEKRLLVEDTYYSNHPEIDRVHLRNEVQKYIAAQGWKIKNIEREEVGSLPLDLEKSFDEIPGEVMSLGAASGVYQPVTGYTFPQTLERVVTLSKLPLFFWREALDDLRSQAESQSSYLRILNRMMFLAAEPAHRYKILERFYRLPEDLIARFYQGRLTVRDQIRILTGKPPVSVIKALKVLW